jgi:RNA polymerase sigma factor (TIGR02999 family)
MSTRSSVAITQLLGRWSAGDREAAAVVLPLVYDELRRIAAGRFRRERPDHTLQATAVVHEAFLRLSEQQGLRWESRCHFYSLASHLMRRILVDHARRHNSAKRGAGVRQVPLTGIVDAVPGEAGGGPDLPDLLALDAALTRLERFDRRQAAVVEMRFYGGLTVEEVAVCLEVSPETVWREWRRARAWLRCELAPAERRPRGGASAGAVGPAPATAGRGTAT